MNNNILIIILILLILIFITLIIYNIYKIFFFIEKKKYKKIKVYLINLDSRKDRLNNFLNNYNLNFSYEKIKAIDKLIINPLELYKKNILGKYGFNNLNKKIRTSHYEFNTKGAIGCYLSHIKTWEKILEDDIDYGIIFEDDVNINKKINDKLLIKYIQKAPKDWDIILLNKNRIKGKRYKENIYKIERFICTHSYIIKKTSINKIISNIYPINQQIDFKLSILAKKNIINIYHFKNKELVYEQNENFTSNIQTDIIKNASWELIDI